MAQRTMTCSATGDDIIDDSDGEMGNNDNVDGNGMTGYDYDDNDGDGAMGDDNNVDGDGATGYDDDDRDGATDDNVNNNMMTYGTTRQHQQ